MPLARRITKSELMIPASVPAAVARSKPKKLLDQTHDVLRLKHYSLRTERSYCDWIERFIRFHQLRHPKEMGVEEITQFLTHLARIGNVSAATQNQALSALLFLYQQVLRQEVGWIDQVERAKRPKRIPVVLTRDEVHKIFAHLHGTPRLMAGLLYGSGIRLMECVRLRVKDVDFGYMRITVRDGKGGKDRITMLPVMEQAGAGKAKDASEEDYRKDGFAGSAVQLPDALERKYRNATS